MQTTITARHCEISDAIRERALAVVERLGNIATRPMEASVVFDTDGQQQTAELRLHLAKSCDDRLGVPTIRPGQAQIDRSVRDIVPHDRTDPLDIRRERSLAHQPRMVSPGRIRRSQP